MILSVLEGVDEGVDSGGHPGEHRGDHVEGGDAEVIIDNIDQHQGQEADQERDEDRQHHLETQGRFGKMARLIPDIFSFLFHHNVCNG